MDKNQVLRKLPQIAELLENDEIKALFISHERNFIAGILRESVDEVRTELLNAVKKGSKVQMNQQDLTQYIISRARSRLKSPYNLKRVVNATGVVMHTNLGRAPLPYEAIQAIKSVSEGYSNLEYDLNRGVRGERYDHVRELLCEITGAEDGLVVNNNAAAVLLCLSALAANREVIISRGELIEVGGSFRIPDVMAQSGAKLIEIGTTNKTHLWDYENAINENTALLLKVHTSNFRVMGFTSHVDKADLVELGKRYNIPVIEDLGSGVFINLESYGWSKEPTVQDSISAGLDLVTFSGDKLLGGPQAGVIVGKSKLISLIKKHPLMRAFRVDKLTLAGLQAVLRLYRDGLWQKIPVLQMLTRPLSSMEEKAQQLASSLNEILGEKAKAEVVDDFSQAGGGALPNDKVPTKAVALCFADKSPQEVSDIFRNAPIPIIGRIQKQKFLLDIRTLSDEDLSIILDVARAVI